MSKVLLLGSTGAVGSQTILSLLSSSSYSSVHALGRRPPTLPATTPNLSKLTTAPNISFEDLLNGDKAEEKKLRDVEADVVLITLGTTRAAAGGMEKFVRIDREYVSAAAKAARVEGKDQRVVYCSSGGASSTSLFPYTKSKGLTEEGLAELGYKECIIFRPGMLIVPGGRGEHRLVESMAA
ncbi:oxidoreductase, partial [Phenoliferia sp. Uapishka_3]